MVVQKTLAVIITHIIRFLSEQNKVLYIAIILPSLNTLCIINSRLAVETLILVAAKCSYYIQVYMTLAAISVLAYCNHIKTN